MSSFLKLFHATERLKKEPRRAFKSNGLPDTVAEHSWRVCLMTLVLSMTVSGIDRDKCLKLALLHDLPETYAGDVYRLDLTAQAGRHNVEEAALKKLVALVPGSTAEEIFGLWHEFEAGTSREARFIRLIDRLEVLLQHNEAGVDRWNDLEKQIQYGLAERHAERYGFLHEFALAIDAETLQKLTAAGYRPEKLDWDTYNRYYST